jgi:hypothetical protein
VENGEAMRRTRRRCQVTLQGSLHFAVGSSLLPLGGHPRARYTDPSVRSQPSELSSRTRYTDPSVRAHRSSWHQQH